MVPLANGGTACVTGTLAISTPRAPLWPMQMQRLKCSHSIQMIQLFANSSPAKGTHLRREEKRANNSKIIVIYGNFPNTFWSDVWPSMVTHTRNLCSAFNPSKCTHTVVNTHPEPMLRRPGSSWVFGLTSVVVLKVERTLVIYSPPQTIPAGPEIRTHNLGLQVQRSIHEATTARSFGSSRQGCNV